MLKKRANKEIKIFSNKKILASFRPVLAVQGAVVFVLTVSLLFIAASLLLPGTQVAYTRIIKTAIIKQTSAAVAKKPVSWAVIVKRQDIKPNQDLVMLPKTANKIKITTITEKEAKEILKKPIPNPKNEFTTKDRKQLIGMFDLDLSGISFKSTNTAGLLELKEVAVRLLKAINSFFLADLEEAAGNVVDEIAEQDNKDIIETNDAKYVDLSEYEVKPASAEASAGEEEKKNEEKKEIKEIEKLGNSETTETADIKEVVEASNEEPTDELGEEPAQSPAEQGIEAGEASGIAQIEVIDSLETVSSADAEIMEATEITDTAETTEIAGSADVFSAIEAGEEQDEYVQVEYETEGPVIKEEETSRGKLVTVSSPDSQPIQQTEGSNDVFAENTEQPQLTDVLAFTTIPEIYKVGQESKIKIKWTNEGGQEMPFTAHDLNNNGKIDYLEWTVPHLSEQIFEIIFISKAFKLNENREIIEDIYDQVRYKDDVWSNFENSQYVRVTFEQILDNTKDITIYAKPTNQGQPAAIEVYTENGAHVIADFPNIDHEGTYRVLLTNLQEPTDVFDLKIIGNAEIDYIVDPIGWLTGYSYRKAITIDHTYVDADLTDFPLYVKLNADTDIGGNLQDTTTCNDIRFASSDGITQLKYEKESCAVSAGAATANYWVKVPTVAGASNTTIYIYYGKASDTDGQDAANVWDSYYYGVYHLSESSGTAYDSTINGNNLTVYGTPVYSVSGVTGSCITFDGSTDYFLGPSYEIDEVEPFGMMAVAKPTDTTGDGTILSMSYKIGATAYSGIYANADSTLLGLEAQNGATYATATSSSTYTIGNTYVVSGNMISDTSRAVFMNGSYKGTNTTSVALYWQNYYTLWLGAHYEGGTSSKKDYFQGDICEARFTDGSRSDDWRKFEGYNINESDNELAFAAQETAVAISGTVYSDEGSTALGSQTVRIAVNGEDSSVTAESNASTGAYSLTVSAAAGDVITVYLEDETADAVTVSVTAGTTMSNINLYQDRLITRQDNSGSLTNANLGTGAVSGEDDISNIYSVSAGALTVADTKELFILSSHTFAPGNTVTADDIDIRGTFSAGSATNISGNFSNSGTFTHNSGTVTFDGTNQSLTGSTTFYNFIKTDSTNNETDLTLTFDNTATQTISGLLTLTGTDDTDRVNLVSNSPGTRWELTANGTFSINYAEVTDSDASGGTTISHTNTNNGGNNLNWGFDAGNTAPSITAGPSDGGSSSTSPTNVGSNAAFTATATDSESDNYYLAICKTNAVTAVNNAAPTCDGGNWCISGSTASASQASCTYTALIGDAESNGWFAFVCDHDAASACSASSQGTGDNGSPFKVNHAPSFSVISDGTDPIDPGSQETFSSTASDSDTDGSADTVTLYVCKSNDFTGTACGAAGEWCHSTASASDPSCNYTIQASDGTGAKNYYGYVIDSHSFSSTSNPRTSTFTINNILPVASSVSIDSAAADVILTEGTTKNVVCAGTVTDNNGYSDITSVTAKLYRSGVGAGAIDDNDNHYTLTGDSQCVPSGGSGNTENYTCTFPVYFYAEPTDAGSAFEAQNWVCQVTPSDAGGAGTAATDTIEMDTLLSLNVSAAIIFGSVPVGNNSTGDYTATVSNVGNAAIDFKVSGGSLNCASHGSVPVANQEYSLSSFTYNSGTDLSVVQTNINADLPKPASATPTVADDTYWQVEIPYGSEGECSGTINFVVISPL